MLNLQILFLWLIYKKLFLSLAELSQFFQVIHNFYHISPIAANHAFSAISSSRAMVEFQNPFML